MKTYDAIVVGGGPAGLTSALYLARGGVSAALVERGAPGGQVLSTAEIENYPGFPKGVKGWELADLFAAHLDGYPVERFFGEVTAIETGGETGCLHKIVFAEGKELIQAKSVVICSGVHYKRLDAPGEARLTGKGVSYCAVCDGNFFHGQDVAVVGGGNSALEEAMYLSRIVNKVYLIHRRDGFRGCRLFQDKISAMPEKIEILTNHVVEEIQGKDNLESLLLRNVRTREEKLISVAGLFIYVGMDPNGSFLPVALNTDAAGLVQTDVEMNTNIPGIFAAGDIRSKNCRQVASAVGDGATAATAALAYLEQINA